MCFLAGGGDGGGRGVGGVAHSPYLAGGGLAKQSRSVCFDRKGEKISTSVCVCLQVSREHHVHLHVSTCQHLSSFASAFA